MAEQERRALALGERNRALAGEVTALKDGFDAVEARARTDLGMVAEGETFYLCWTRRGPIRNREHA